MAGKYHERLAEFTQNIEQAISTYSDALRQLEKINPDAIETGFNKYTKFLKEHSAEDQITVLRTVKDHFAAYVREKRVNKDRWLDDFANAGT